MSSSKKLEEIKSMLPLYSKGLLTRKEQEEIERVISENPELQKELVFWNMVNRGYERIKNDLPAPPENVYSKIATKIKEKNEQKSGFFNFFRLYPKFSFGVILGEFLLIIGLIFYIFNLKYEYRTLSVSEIRAETTFKFNVIFNENAKEKEIRELLKKIDGRIIDGPSKTGLYVIGIKDEKNKEKVLEFLRNSNIIFLTEYAN